MGTFYQLSSRFIARKGVEEREIREWLKKRMPDEEWRHLKGEDGCDFRIEDKDGRLMVILHFSNQCAYETAESLDEEWAELAAQFADFSAGPVWCTSDGEDYDDGPAEWAVGPEKVVITGQLSDLTTQIRNLMADRKRLRQELPKAGNRMVRGLPGEYTEVELPKEKADAS